MKHFFKNLNVNMENKGNEIVITIKGDKEKLSLVEKKLKTLKELCCCGHDKENSCC